MRRTAALVCYAQRDSNGETVFVAKIAELKSTVGGRKVAGRVLGETLRDQELLLVGTSSRRARLCRPSVCLGPPVVQLRPAAARSDADAWGSEALSRAQEHHLRARNELPLPGVAPVRGEAAIPTRYERSDRPARSAI